MDLALFPLVRQYKMADITFFNENIDIKLVNIWLENLLNAEQLETYKAIANERLNIYLQGFFIGLVLAVLSLNFVRQLKKMPTGNKVCLFIVMCFIENIFLSSTVIFYQSF